MKKTIAVLFLLVFCSNALAQEEDVLKVVLEFSGFKRPHSEFTIDYRKHTFAFKATYPVDKEPFFNRACGFKDAEFARLKAELANDIPQTDTEKFEEAIDGGGFVIKYFKHGGGITKLIIGNPVRELSKYSSEFKKIDAFFEFAYKIVTNPIGIDAMDQTYRPYFEGLPIRKVSEEPLEYRIWGSMTGGGSRDDDYGFIAFLNNLPKDQCIIIDCNNQLSWSWQNDILERYIIKNTNLHFVNNDRLKFTRQYLVKIREAILSTADEEAALEKFNNKMAYNIYISDRRGIDNWLELPESSLYITVEEMRKRCR